MARRNPNELLEAVREIKPKILALMTAKGRMKPIAICRELGIDENLCRPALEQMRQEGLFASTGKIYQLKTGFAPDDAPITPSSLPMVWKEGDEIVTDSQTLAAYFEKEHRNVLQAIRNYLDSEDEAVKEYGALNFKLANYMDSQGKPREAFKMTEGGFALVALGFTGVKADRTRVRFLQQFEQMKMQLKQVVVQDQHYVQVLEERAFEILRVLATGQVDLRSDMAGVKEKLVDVEQRVTGLDEKISNVIPIQRNGFSKKVQKVWMRVIEIYYRGCCPICEEKVILENGEWKTGHVQLAHTGDRDKNGVDDGIPACPGCHAHHRNPKGMGRFDQAPEIIQWIKRVRVYTNYDNSKQTKLFSDSMAIRL